MCNLQKKKLVIVMNGKGGVGKDALCDALTVAYRVKNVSAITPIKEIASRYGWNGEKDEKGRRFLAELKRVFVEYNDLPNKYLLDEYRAFLESDDDVLCVHIREKEEIAKFVAGVDTPCVTVLVRRTAIDGGQAYGNDADDKVGEYTYDWEFSNDLPLEESGEAFRTLIARVIDGFYAE